MPGSTSLLFSLFRDDLGRRHSSTDSASLRASGIAGFSIEPRNMSFYCALRKLQSVRNLLIGESFAYKEVDFLFPGRQRYDVRCCASVCQKKFMPRQDLLPGNGIDVGFCPSADGIGNTDQCKGRCRSFRSVEG